MINVESHNPQDFEFGSDEHISGLSRSALEAEFKYAVSRMNEMEKAYDKLYAEYQSYKQFARLVIDHVLDLYKE